MPPGGSTNNAQKRLYYLGAFLFAWILLVCCRLVFLQVFSYGDFVVRAQRQQQRTFDVPAKRGIIYDRNGHELAMSVQVDSVFAVPSEIPDQASTANLLATVLGSDPNELLARMKSQRNFAWLARKLDSDTSARVRALNLRGIYFQKEPRRYYPKRDLAAQVLGYVGLDDEGLAGIEGKFDDSLRGNPGLKMMSIDARRRSHDDTERQPEPGANIVLTIDEKIQYIVEKELDQAMLETGAEAATAIVQKPRTGEILALANRPTFNPNVQREIKPAALKNRAVSDVYEPGSTFKIVTISSALEEKLAKPDELIDCQNGSIVVNGLRIRDHEALGLITVSQVLARSSDVGSIKLGMRLGNERFDSYIRAFGFGAQSGIELPGETKGLHKPASRWSKVSIGAISMGQEIGVSPVQLVSMISTIANDGLYTPPRIVAGMTAPSNTYQTVVYKPPQQRRVISPLTSAEMRKMMEGVVLFGTGRKAILDGYTSAGKTGTAQKVDPATGTYSKTKYIGSFAGFAPVNEPAVTIVVILDSANKKGLHQGGQVAAPVFTRIAQQVLSYLNVPRDAEVKNDPRRLLLRAKVKDEELNESSPDRLGETLQFADTEQPAASQPPPVMASSKAAPGAVNAAYPAPPSAQAKPDKPSTTSPEAISPASTATQTTAPNNGTVVLDVGNGSVVPSFIGKSLRGAIETAQQSGYELNIIGSGVAREQSPAPGTRLPQGAKVSVRFAR